MKNLYRLLLLVFWGVFTVFCYDIKAQETITHIPEINIQSKKKKTVIYTQLNIQPDVEEIKMATENSFFGALTDKKLRNGAIRSVFSNSYINFDEDIQPQILELCKNNDADFAVIPYIKFFKVGFGRYIFSSQVIVTLDLYDSYGVLLSSNSYDTLKRKGRMFGSAENSIKKGATGAYKMMKKSIY